MCFEQCWNVCFIVCSSGLLFLAYVKTLLFKLLNWKPHKVCDPDMSFIAKICLVLFSFWSYSTVKIPGSETFWRLSCTEFMESFLDLGHLFENKLTIFFYSKCVFALSKVTSEVIIPFILKCFPFGNCDCGVNLVRGILQQIRNIIIAYSTPASDHSMIFPSSKFNRFMHSS